MGTGGPTHRCNKVVKSGYFGYVERAGTSGLGCLHYMCKVPHETEQSRGQMLPHCSGTLRSPKTQTLKLVFQFVIQVIFVHGKLCLETESVFANNLFNSCSLWEL